MMGESRPLRITSSELVEKLNHLEYVVENTKKVVTTFKNGPLEGQTGDFLRFMEIVKDAIAAYRDEVADQVDIE
jgi:hypothetical protein